MLTLTIYWMITGKFHSSGQFHLTDWAITWSVAGCLLGGRIFPKGRFLMTLIPWDFTQVYVSQGGFFPRRTIPKGAFSQGNLSQGGFLPRRTFPKGTFPKGLFSRWLFPRDRFPRVLFYRHIFHTAEHCFFFSGRYDN